MPRPKERQNTPKPDTLTPQQARFVALLGNSSIVTAAAELGISERTAQRWAKLPTVTAALRRQADDVLSEAARLARAELAANRATLRELRDSKDTPPNVRLAAAARLTDDALRLTSDQDIAQRLSDVERRLNEHSPQTGPGGITLVA